MFNTKLQTKCAAPVYFPVTWNDLLLFLNFYL